MPSEDTESALTNLSQISLSWQRFWGIEKRGLTRSPTSKCLPFGEKVVKIGVQWIP